MYVPPFSTSELPKAASKLSLCFAVLSIGIPFSAACEETPAQASARAKNAVALLDWAGTTASAFYGIYDADLKYKVPGNQYENLANDVAYRIQTSKSASSLVSAPFSLAADALSTGAMLDPEPLTMVVASVSSYGVRKLGESIGSEVYAHGRADALEVLSKGLNREKYSAAQLSSMNDEQLKTAISNMRIGQDKMSTILKDDPDAMKMLQAHGIDFIREISATALLETRQTSKTVGEISKSLSETNKVLTEFKQATFSKLESLDDAMKQVQASVVQTQASINDLKAEVAGNTKSIQSLALISSASWSPRQKLDAINSGLFPELGLKEKASTIVALESQIKTEETIKTFQNIAGDLGNMGVIAKNLGVNSSLVTALQQGQQVAQGIAQFASGNVLGGLASVSGVMGMGAPDAAAERQKQLMNYLHAEFEKINEKLDVILKQQQQILAGINSINKQLSVINNKLDTIERVVIDNNIILQNLVESAWRDCDAFINTLNTFHPAKFSDISNIIDDSNGRSYLVNCYSRYLTEFDGIIRTPMWAGGHFSAAAMPSDIIITDQDQLKFVKDRSRRTDTAYRATRNFILSASTEASIKPAALLAALADPKTNTVAAASRDMKISSLSATFDGFLCDSKGNILNSSMSTLICQGKDDTTLKPNDSRLAVLLNPDLLGPQVYRAIDVGLPLSELAVFIYATGATDRDVISAEELRSAAQHGMSSNMMRAAKFKGKEKLLERLGWLTGLNLLQQSLISGDFAASKAFTALYNSGTKSLSFDAATANNTQRAALDALRANPTLARNVAMLAVREALRREVTEGGKKIQTIAVTNYALGLQLYSGKFGCINDNIASSWLQNLLPEWKFVLRAYPEEKAENPDLSQCAEADPTSEMGSGVFVQFAGLEIKLPTPQAVKEGMFEVPQSLRLAMFYHNKVMVAIGQSEIAGIVRKLPAASATAAPFVAQLLSSQCLSGRCILHKEPERP